LKNFCRKECAELEISDRYYHGSRNEGVKEPLRILEVAAETKLRRDRGLEI
jgi:hypothetical protein